MTAAIHTPEAPARTRQFGAGEVVLYPGAADDLYQVNAGLVRLHTVDDDGFGATLRYVKPGGYFGEEALTGKQRRYFADAITDSTVLAFDARQLGPAEVRAVAVDLALAMDRMNRSLLRLAGKPLKARVAAELLELSDSALAVRSPDGVPTIRMTHDELAAGVGS
ncbi:MAG TPA: cyclic nucleotide-binding domain-containing protein, partial [Trueperaceae bacterium]|nr:cyclic nucleotide-binding domain-containing protein [Trueperaceae bacterium]